MEAMTSPTSRGRALCAEQYPSMSAATSCTRAIIIIMARNIPASLVVSYFDGDSSAISEFVAEGSDDDLGMEDSDYEHACGATMKTWILVGYMYI